MKGGQALAMLVPAQGSELGGLRSAWISLLGQQLLGWTLADVGGGLLETLEKITRKGDFLQHIHPSITAQ